MANPHPLLVDALRLLPGIRPAHERGRLGEARHRAWVSPERVTVFNGVLLTLAQLEELFLYGKHGGPRISPEGAKLLLHLFEDNAFECSDARSVPEGLDLLRQYSNGKVSIIDYRPRRVARQLGEVEKNTGRIRSTSLSIV
jgi:hypothetical protein